MPKKLSIKTNFVLIGMVIGLFIGVSIEQVLGETTSVPGTAQGNTLAVNMSGQYMNGLIVANGNALILNGKMSIGNIDPINVLTVTGKAQSNGLCIGTSCITSWDDLKTIFGIEVPPIPIDSTQNKLPPTGITNYSDVNTNTADASVAADTGAFPRQDARYARPFDYTKIANDGSTLPATATLGTGAKDWACTKDNITGFIWEVKTSSGLRSKDNTYTWYNSDTATNGGDVGFASDKGHDNNNVILTNTCNTTGRCDTEKFVADVNGVGLCGHNSSWRLPTVKELEGIIDFSQLYPAIDTNYFPNTASRYTWTSTLDSIDNLYAWTVDYATGIVMSQVRFGPIAVRLVWTGSPAPSVHDVTCSDTNPIASNPDNVYDTTTVPGTAIDTRSGLMWQRCSVGQTWNGSTCTGSSQGGPWATVLQQSVSNKFANFTDWRVPNVKELRSLVEECRGNAPLSIPSINNTIFPNTPIDVYYTSSPSKLSLGNYSLSWVVGFNKGTLNTSERYTGAFVRLVRDIKVNSSNAVCTGTVPIGTNKSSVTPTTSTPWSYNTSGATCTYKCDSTHSWNGSSCIAKVTQVTIRKLPPTGITIYADNYDNVADASVAADTGAFPRQDARYNRPFDYTKIANDGTSLPATATLGTGAKDWACTKDNITGLVWEMKTTSGLRNKDYTYTWYQNGEGTPDDSSNGPFGQEPPRVCQTTGHCDTEKYVEDVKATSLCGQSDWRMPSVKELEGIADFSQENTAIDLSYFPNTPVYSKPRPLSWWSGTASANGPSDTSVYYAWTVSAGDGHADAKTRSTPFSVRVVHGTASPEATAAICQPNRLASNPDSAYSTTQNDGTVTDTRTGLMWKRCSEGQVWENGTCTGTISGNYWGQALMLGRNSTFVGYSDWRLPNVKELRSLVEECRFNPAINVTIFPATSGQYYWTSSPAVYLFGNTDVSWVVDFTGGLSHSLIGRGPTFPVRLVRDITP